MKPKKVAAIALRSNLKVLCGGYKFLHSSYLTLIFVHGIIVY